MTSGIFAIANIGVERLYIGEVHHLKTRWPKILAELEQGCFCDHTIQHAWQMTQGDRRFSFHTAKDIKADQTIRGRQQFFHDCQPNPTP